MINLTLTYEELALRAITDKLCKETRDKLPKTLVRYEEPTSYYNGMRAVRKERINLGEVVIENWI